MGRLTKKLDGFFGKKDEVQERKNPPVMSYDQPVYYVDSAPPSPPPKKKLGDVA